MAKNPKTLWIDVSQPGRVLISENPVPTAEIYQRVDKTDVRAQREDHSDLDGLRVVISHLQADYREVHRERNRLEREVGVLKDNEAGYKRSIKTLEAKITEVKGERDELRDKLATAESLLAEAFDVNTKGNEQNLELRRRAHLQKDTIDRQRALIARLRARVTKEN